jgi:hypothetical protein
MAIAAQRFSFLNQQTNVPVADFISQSSSDLLNSAQNDLKTISDNLTNLVNSNAIGPIHNLLSNSGSLSNLFGSLGQVRVTKDFFSSGISLTANPGNVLANAAKSLSGTNTGLATSLLQLSSACQSSALGGIGARKSQNPLINCASSNTPRQGSLAGCDLNKLSSVIANASGGVYNPSIYNGFNIENATSLIGIAGYKAALCGVFSALTSNMTNIDSISRIASNMIGAAATSSDIRSVIDIGATLAKGNVTSIIPGVSSLIFSHYQQPKDINNSQLPGLYTGLNGAMNNIDPNWCTDPSTGLQSSVNLGGSNASNFQSINQLMTADSANTPVTPSLDGSVVSLSNSSALISANYFSQSDPLSSLSASGLI